MIQDFLLENSFEMQKHLTCLTIDPWYVLTILHICSCKKDDNYNPGLSLAKLTDILEHHFIKTEEHICTDSSEESIQKFRENLKKVLSKRKELIILNFDGSVCGLQTGGHFSTVGAYNEEMDYF